MTVATDTDGLVERFNEVAAINVDAAFDEFKAEEVRALSRYARVCTRLNDRALLREGARFEFSAGIEGETERLQHAGEDPLRSAMMDFRLIWMDSEPAQFSRIRNIVRSRAAESSPEGNEALAVIDALGKDMSEARKEPTLGAHDPESGEIRTVQRAADLIDDWLNGVSFHEDPDRAERVEAWSRSTYEYMLIRSVNRVANVGFALAVLVDAILDAQSDPVATPRKDRKTSTALSEGL